MQLDFTTTATVRPEILDRTYTSFARNLRGVDLKNCRLFINIDPVPVTGGGPDMLEVAGRHFGRVCSRFPNEPSFPKAVKWCWSKPETEFFFHLEDDWELLEPVDVGELTAYMRQPDLACVNLRAYSFPYGDSRICLSPCLMRSAHARILGGRLVENANPEKQLRPATSVNKHGGRHEGFRGVQHPADDTRRVIQDLGREWLEKSGWKKTIPVHFTRWTKA